MTDTIRIDDMLNQFGITSKNAQQTARNALFQSRIIQKNPSRLNISDHKIDRARQVLNEQFLWHCNNGDCRREAGAQNTVKPLLLVEQYGCHVCGGSPGAEALRNMTGSATDAGKSRILVVGGTEKKEREIRQKSSASIEWRFIDSTKARGDRYYRSDRDWAHIIIIWQSTPVDHPVSSHFDGKGDSRVITVRRRGIGCLATEIISHCQKG